MGFTVLALFFVLFMLGFPVAVSVLLPAILYILTNNIPIDIIAQRIQYSLDSYTLIAVPVFIFAGNLMNSSGITNRIFNFADTLVGRLPGGLAQVNIFGSLIFAGMSGAALADVGGLGMVEIDAMKNKGFSVPFSAAVTIASATVGPIFPPSIPLVIYGSVASVSIGKLLLGGIGPAILATITMMIITVVLSFRRGMPRAERWPSLRKLMTDFFPAFPALMTPVLLIAGMILGFFTPTEAASIVVAYMLIVSFFYRELTWQHLLKAAWETVRSTSGILIIVGAAAIFGWILAIEQIPQLFSQSLLSVSKEPWVLLLILNGMLLIVGMFLDSTTAILLMVPIVVPPLVSVGIDPIHLGLVFVFNIMLGLITPPMGLSLFLVCDMAKVSMREVIVEVVPYFITLVVTLLIITYIPAITLFIPGLVK